MKLIGKVNREGKTEVPEISIMVLPERKHGVVIGTSDI